GAGLGLIWVAAEFNRHKKGFNMAGMQIYYPDPEGKDLASFVALSVKQTLGTGSASIRLPTANLFKHPKTRDLPMCFFYGDEDAAGKSFAQYLYGPKVLNAESKTKPLKLTFEIPMKGTKLTGQELLGKKALETEVFVAKYISEKVKEARSAKVWTERD